MGLAPSAAAADALGEQVRHRSTVWAAVGTVPGRDSPRYLVVEGLPTAVGARSLAELHGVPKVTHCGVDSERFEPTPGQRMITHSEQGLHLIRGDHAADGDLGHATFAFYSPRALRHP